MSSLSRTVTDRFPPAVLATAFATFVAFLGIGVVDPVLPLIGEKLHASGAQVELLFTTYLVVMAFAMLVSGVLSARFGNKRVIIAGLAIVVVMSTLAGLSNSINQLAIVRGGWGFGNALFTSTALAVIVGLAAGGTEQAIMLYEAALGLGIAGGPLLGGYLGTYSWRYPFFGTATLMVLALIVTVVLLREPEGKEQATPADMLMALKSPPVLVNALIGLCYSFGFFTILAYSPLTMDLTATTLGLTFFAWGALVAISSVFVVDWLKSRFDASKVLFADVLGMALVLTAAGFAQGRTELLIPLVVISGVFCGIANAMFTTFAIQVSPFTRSVSSGAYNFLRWAGAAIAPVLAGYLKDTYNPSVPFYVGAVVVFIGALGLLGGGSFLLSAINENATKSISAD